MSRGSVPAGVGPGTTRSRACGTTTTPVELELVNKEGESTETLLIN